MLLQFLSGARRVLVPGLLCILAAGCTTTAKLNSFAELSKVGIAYSDAAGAVIDQAADGSIDADTATLLVTRELEDDPAKRRQALTDQSKALREQLAVFSRIRRHQELIKEYFVTLGALADAGDADSAIGSSAGGIIAALGKLSPGFENLKFGDQSVKDFTEQAVPLLVANLRSRALEQELRTNGKAIDRELLASEALMGFLAEKIQADDAAVQGPREADAVFTPYIRGEDLPDDWPATRQAFLERSVDMSAVGNAQAAARKLRTALTAASEGRLAPGQLQLLVNDLTALVEILENVKGKP
ncbi:MAG TPA: hypothetical protein VFV88_09375 [Steroidobacteraceae bacterium]|jgi:hypothetical protein|nr:hypothetical protein [Steroidobacteraceae bacterium]